ncbi:MAG: DUF1990 family protein [Terriglobales bacterium]
MVYVIDERGATTGGASECDSIRRYGFAYGTLQEHAESGEERFSVEWNLANDEVIFDLLAFSRPHALLARLGYPVSRYYQRRFIACSLQRMAEAVSSA